MGVNIPVSLQGAFYDSLDITLRKGETRKIRVLLDGVEYVVPLSNIGFDEQKFRGHKDLLQLRWTPKSPIAKRLQSIFWSSFQYLGSKRAVSPDKRQKLSVPSSQQEYLVLYSSKTIPDTIVLECITCDEICEGKASVQSFNELWVEELLQSKDNADVILRPRLVKLRKLDQSIGEGLKRFYGYKCQICGLSVGDPYSTTVAHTHHIEYFSRSLNNDASNIMIVCPNHHSVIHAVDPDFDWERKQFIYPNGFREGLQLNKHL